jgi:hypothetical protein
MLLLSSEPPPPPWALYALLSARASDRGYLTPALLLIDRLGGFWRSSWCFNLWRDPLECGHEQPPSFGVGLALGVELLPERGDKRGGAIFGFSSALVADLVGLLAMTWLRLIVAQ